MGRKCLGFPFAHTFDKESVGRMVRTRPNTVNLPLESLMRQSLLVLAFVLCASPLVVAEAPEAVTPQPAEARVTLEDLLAPAPAADPAEACDAPMAENASTVWCPFGVPACVEHDDCDDYCGHPDFGSCERQGYFPIGCCLCLG